MESVKRHYDALVKGINRDRKEDKFNRLEEYQIKYTVVNLNLRQHVFKWGLKEWGMMHEMKALAGPNDTVRDNASSSKFANMGKRLDNKNFFSKGKLPIPHYPYYGEIWGKVAVSSRKAEDGMIALSLYLLLLFINLFSLLWNMHSPRPALHSLKSA